MKLVLSVEALTPKLTGIGRYTWELATRLPHLMENDQISFFRNNQWVRDPAKLLLNSKIENNSIVRAALPRWANFGLLRRECRGSVFHGPNYFLPACIDAGVATIHDLSVFKYPETHPVERVRQFEEKFSQSIARSTHLITDSEATRQEVINFLGWPEEKITAIHLGVSSEFRPKETAELLPSLHKYGLKPGAYTLCVSTLEPRKKIAHLLKSYQALPTQLRQQFPLVLVGSFGWLSEDLHIEINNLSTQGWIHYLGFVPESDLPDLYAGAKLFVYPSIYEGFGLPVLEAMACGVPVVTSNKTSLPEITQGAATLVDPDDIDEIVEGIKRALTDTCWQTQASENGRKVAGTYTWDKCTERTISVYRKLFKELQ